MLCQMCHKNLSTVRYAEVVNGKVSDVHLCASCLAKHQQDATSGFGLANSAVPVPPAQSVAAGLNTIIPQKSCPSCGMELIDALQKGKVGCPVCYDAFSDQLENALREFHFSLIHRGKIPRQTDSRARMRADLQKKRALLRSSLKVENYEKAASLRDEIRGLETQLGVLESEPE